VSIAAVSPTPPVPLPTTATPVEVVANNAAFQQSLIPAAPAAGPSATSSFNTLPAQGLGTTPNETFQAYLVDTFLGVTSTPVPNPFGTTLPGNELGLPAYDLPVYVNPFAQHGLGINVSSLQ
jgi:hypothetical protein